MRIHVKYLAITLHTVRAPHVYSYTINVINLLGRGGSGEHCALKRFQITFLSIITVHVMSPLTGTTSVTRDLGWSPGAVPD